MPIFKTLRAAGAGEHILNGRVASGWESWNALDAALNELGALGWEIDTPLYGSVPGAGQPATTWPMAIILINRTADIDAEKQRQIAKLNRELTEIDAKFGMSSRQRELQEILDGLLGGNKGDAFSS